MHWTRTVHSPLGCSLDWFIPTNSNPRNPSRGNKLILTLFEVSTSLNPKSSCAQQVRVYYNATGSKDGYPKSRRFWNRLNLRFSPWMNLRYSKAYRDLCLQIRLHSAFHIRKVEDVDLVTCIHALGIAYAYVFASTNSAHVQIRNRERRTPS